MFSTELYKIVLTDPINNSRANKLFIVSGYASATFARRHILDLKKVENNIEINLIIGMPGKRSDHMAFVNLHNEYPGQFKGYYVNTTPPVHSKVYSWFKGDRPVAGFTGSANYSQYGFIEEMQLNQISIEDPGLIKSYYDSLIRRCIFIPDSEIVVPAGHRVQAVTTSVPAGQIQWEIPDKRVRISFLDKQGNLPAISGLNWGQRVEKRKNPTTGEITDVRREPNQAYLSFKMDSRKEGFLPPRALTFTLITDDGKSFDCVVAQDGRKAIHTTDDNSIIGKYIRNRVGVPLGAPVSVEDLEHYGRTDYTIEKINDETFLLDFSVIKK